MRGQQSLEQVLVGERTQSVCASPRVVTLGSVGENNGSMCCCALFGYGYDTWMLHDDRTGFILQHKSLLHEKCRVKPSGRESKNVPNRTKVKVLFNL